MRLFPALILGFLGFSLAASPAEATVREWLMRQAGIDPNLLQSTPSVRLAGMGNVGLCVPDEANELNTYDFGRNIAGLYADSDRWVIDTWFSGALQQGDRTGMDSERRFGNAGARAVYRSSKNALGIDINWTYFETTDHPGDWAKVRGPLVSGIVNQCLGPITLGVRVGWEQENEDRISSDFFTIRHRQGRCVGQVGAELEHWGHIFAGAWEFQRANVEGTSADPSRFHEDNFSWSYPVDRYSVVFLLQPGGRTEGGLRGMFMDRQGGEKAEISWSDRSPENPSQSNYFDDVETFHEEEFEMELLTRWRFKLGGRTILGLEGAYRQWEYDVVEGLNFKGSNHAGSWDYKVLSIGAGMSRSFNEGRLLAAVQVRGLRGEWTSDEEMTHEGGTAQQGSVSAAVEYFVSEDVVIRWGVSAASRDQDVDAPLTLALGWGGSGGITWVPWGGMIQLNGAVRYSEKDPWHEDAGDLEGGSQTSYLLGLRLLL